MALTLPSTYFASSALVANGALLVIGGGDSAKPGRRSLIPSNLIWPLNVTEFPLKSVTQSLRLTSSTGSTESLAPSMYTRCVFDEKRFHIYCLGGYVEDWDIRPSGLYSLDLNTETWRLVNSTELPVVASQSMVMMDDGFVYSLGGWNQKANLDGYRIDPTNAKVQTIAASSGPDSRNSGCAVSLNSTHILQYGGQEPFLAYQYGDVWILNTLTSTWTNITTAAPPQNTNTPTPRAYHTCVTDQEKTSMFVFGGTSTRANDTGTFTTTYNDLWSLNLSSFTWSKLSGGGFPDQNPVNVTLGPAERWNHFAVGVGGYMVIGGGSLKDDSLDSVLYFWDMKNRRWVERPDAKLELPASLQYRAPGTFTNSNESNPSTPSKGSTAGSASSFPTLPVVGAIVGTVILIVGLVSATLIHRRRKQLRVKKEEEDKEHLEELGGKKLTIVGTGSTSSGTVVRDVERDASPKKGGLFDGLRGNIDANLEMGSRDRFEDQSTPPTYRSNGSPMYDSPSNNLGGRPLGPPVAMFVPHVLDDTLIDDGTLGPLIDSPQNRIHVDAFDVLPAEDLHTRSRVAVKVFGWKEESGQGAQYAFKREVGMMRKLQSKYTAELKSFHALQTPNTPLFLSVTTLYPETLANFISRTPHLPDLLIRTLTKGLADALKYLHVEMGIIHADLKPSNIVLVDGVFVRLIDLESARCIDRETVSSVSWAYSAPELAGCHLQNMQNPTFNSSSASKGWVSMGVLAHPGVDMWSLGCIVFEMYTRRPLLSNMTEPQMLEFLTDQNPIEIPSSLVEPIQARHLLASLLSKDPGQRKSASAVLSSAYLNSGQDTIQISQSFEGVQEKLHLVQRQVEIVSMDTKKVLENQGVLRKIIIGSLEPVVPRIVALLPMGRGKWERMETWGSDVFKMHLLCEWKGSSEEGGAGPHLTEDPGYDVLDPRQFLRDLGPIIRAGTQVATVALGVGTAIALGRPGGMVSTQQMFAQMGLRPTEYFQSLTKMLEASKERGDGAEKDQMFAERIDEVAARELVEFLKRVDPGRRCGGLKRCVDGEGSIVWLCDHHAARFKQDD
ncbi:hypothetical protein HDV05_000102 [Chytridiales sp. JEL 0842]|nr:hypothetical protein HDV05_000102 [Chytridiales sp. JEL 0842]